MIRARLVSTIAATLCAGLLAACGGDGSNAPEDAEPRPVKAGDFGTRTATGANKWYPVRPGYQSVRLGGVNRGSRRLPHRRVYTITDVSKAVNGVRTVIALDQDFDGGQIAEQALDYLAEDKQGNVWYLGSYTEAYEGGQFVNVNDAWLNGVKGGQGGILVPADPRPGMPAYIQAHPPGAEADVARIVRIDTSRCVPFKCFKRVLVVEEDGSEYKYLAAGVGEIGLESLESGGEQETEELINLTQLSDRGLAELSAEALKLDRHAMTTVPGVFGSSKPAERLR